MPTTIIPLQHHYYAQLRAHHSGACQLLDVYSPAGVLVWACCLHIDEAAAVVAADIEARA